MSASGGQPLAPGQGGQPQGEPREDVVKAVIERYYTRGLDAVDRARQRAERGYTIASAIAAALVAAGLLAHLQERPSVVQVLALVGFGLWLLAALFFMFAVAIKVDVKEPEGFADARAFLSGIAAQLRDEIRIINNRLRNAVVVTAVATGVTIAAVAFGVTNTGSAKPVASRVELTSPGNRALTRLCGRRVGLVYATISPDKLSDSVVALKLPAGECRVGATVAHVPKGEITATEDIGEFPTFPQG